MANTLSNVLPKILANGLLALREAAIMPRLVNTDFGEDAAQKGDVINIPVSKPGNPRDVTPSPNYSSATAHAPANVQVPLNQWKHDDFYLTDKEMAEIARDRHFIPLAMSEVVKGLANLMDGHVHNQYTGVYGYVGTAGVVPFSTVATATNTRKVLNEQLAPMNDRRVILDPTAEAQALALSAFSDVEKTQDRPVKIEGELGRKFGMDYFMSQNVVTHTAGTASLDIEVASTTAAGVSTLLIRAGSTIGTLVTGDVFNIAGHAQTYAITGATAALTSAGVNFTIAPALQVAVTTGTELTKRATHVVNLGFQRNAFAFANRPLQTATAGTRGGNEFASATDPVTGLSLRLEIIRQNKQDAWDFDVLYGSKLVRPQLATRIAG